MTWGNEMGLKAESKHSAWVFFIDTLRGLNMSESSSLRAFALVEPHARSMLPYGSCEVECLSLREPSLCPD